MIQLKVYNSIAKTQQFFIDLYETEPIKLTLSIEDITNADATSTFSKTFKVPGTRANAEFFKNSFDVDGTLFDVTVKKPAEILVDGAEFKQGQVRLQRVYLNTDLDRYDYELIFLGETRDFSSKIGDRGLCELQLPDLIGGDGGGPLTQDDITLSWQAYPQTNNLTAGLHNGNIIFPLIDHGNTYVNNQNGDQARIATTGSNRFTQANHPLTLDRFKPMIRAKRIWDQIFADAGYTYTSQFIESNLFKQMYVSAFGNEATVGWNSTASSTTSSNVAYAASPVNNTNQIGPIFLPSAVNDPGGNLYNAIFPFSGSQYGGQQYTYYEVPSPGTYVIQAEGYYSGFQESSDYISTAVFQQLNLYSVPTGGGAPVIVASSFPGHAETLQFSETLITGVTPGFNVGDQLILVLGDISGNGVDNLQTSDFLLEVLQAPGDFNPVSSLECVYKQIDFIKDMLTAFRLVLSPDPNNVQNFIVEPWQNYINSGELYDWSHKLVQDKDFVIEPLFYTQLAEIDFKFQMDGDYANVYHEQAYRQPYGYLEFNANNDLLIGKREVKLGGIAPTIIVNLEGTTPANNFNIAQLHTHSQDGNITQHLPIKPKTRFLFYNGLQAASSTWYFDGASPEARTTYPLVSPYQTWPIQPQTLNLNWANDVQYWGTTAGYNQNGTTLYTNYWSRYLNFLYGKYSRRVTAYFILNNVDLNTFSFDDTIFINGTYYRPEKIIDVEVGAYTQVKVQLLTSNDFKPQIIPFQSLLECSAVGVASPCAFDEGSITVTTNGTPGFTWQLSNGQSGGVLAGTPAGQAPYVFSIPNIAVGTYTLLIEDSLGRTKQLTVTVPASSATPVVATQVVTPASDCNTCDGAITVTPSGGTAPYTIEWGDSTFITSFTRTGLCPGQYSYIVYDFFGCAQQSYFANVSCEAAPGDVWRFYRASNDCQQIFNDVRYVFFPTGTSPALGSFYELGLIGGGTILSCWTPVDIVQETANAVIIQSYQSCEACNNIQPSENFLMINCISGTIQVVAGVPGIAVGQAWNLIGLKGCFVVDSISESGIVTATLGTGPYINCEDCLNPTPSFSNFIMQRCDGAEFIIAQLPAGALAGQVYLLSNDLCYIVQDLTLEAASQFNIEGPFVDCATCAPPPQELCVTNYGAAMVPCSGGTLDDHMEGYVQLSGPTPVDVQFIITVGYGEGTGFKCLNPQIFTELFVNIAAGQDFGILDCSNGAPFISFNGATICQAVLQQGPYPEC